MKKFIAFLLIKAYSLISFGAPVAMHQCSDKQHPSFPSEFSSHQSSAGCGNLVMTAMNCCTNTDQVCSIKTDENTADVNLNKGHSGQYQIFFAAFESPQYHIPLTSSSAKVDVPLNIYKIRLHLYQRVLLI